MASTKPLEATSSVAVTQLRAANKRKHRIVPDSQRKRIAVSCDRCRKRKLRCRATEADESSYAGVSKKTGNAANAMGTNDTCSECLKAGASCTRILPRKKRVYGSVDTLSMHYQALLLVIKHLFPDQDCDALPGILKIAKDLKITIPENLDPEAVPESAFLASRPEVESSSSVPIAEQPKPPFQRSNSDPIRFNLDASPTGTVKIKSEGTLERKPLPDLGSERIIYDRVGVPYYVGSSGSMAFFDSLCKIIGKKNEQQQTDGLRAPRMAADTQPESIDSLAVNPGEALRSRRDNSGAFFYTISASTFADSAMFSLPDVDQVSLLPPKPECDIYIDAFIANVNSLFPFFRIKPFRAKYEQYWADIRSTQHSKSKWEAQIDWRCCLYMVIVTGARSLIEDKETSRKYGALSKYASVVQGALSILTVTTSLETVQALFLLSYYFYGINERNAAWLMAGITIRQAMAMGFHRESACASCTPEEAKQRKQVWYTLYSFELTLCANLGRPSCIRHEDIDVAPSDDLDEDISLYYAPGCYHTNIKLLEPFSDIISNMHLAEFKGLLTQRNIDYTLNSARKLKDFLGNLPPQLRELQPSQSYYHTRSILKTHMRTHYTISILSRPFVLYLAGADCDQISPQKLDDLILILNVGCASTIAISQILTTLSKRCLVNGVYHIDIFYGYCACLVLSLVSVIVSSGKLPQEKLAYTKEAINSAISAIVKIMDSVYLEGTMLRLARVTASILSGLGIELQHKQSENPEYASKDLKPFESAGPAFSNTSTDVAPIALNKLSPNNDMFPLALLEDYERMFTPRDVAFNGNGESNMADFNQQQPSDLSHVNMEDLDLFTETFNTSFYDVSNTFNFTNIFFPPSSPEITNGAPIRQSYPSNAEQHQADQGLLFQDDPGRGTNAGVGTSAGISNNTDVIDLTNNDSAGIATQDRITGYKVGAQGYMEPLYNRGDVGVISNLTWMKEDHGKSQLMDYVKQKSKQKLL